MIWHAIKDSLPSDHDERYRIPVIICRVDSDHMELATFHRMYETYYDFYSYEHKYDKPNGYEKDDMLEEEWDFFFIIPKIKIIA